MRVSDLRALAVAVETVRMEPWPYAGYKPGAGISLTDAVDENYFVAVSPSAILFLLDHVPADLELPE